VQAAEATGKEVHQQLLGAFLFSLECRSGHYSIHDMNRRIFLTLAAACSGIPQLGAIEPISRKGKPKLMLGLAAYSFRKSMKWMRGKPVTAPEGTPSWDLFDFIDYCADQGCQGAELTSYFFPPDVDEKYLLEIKRHAYLRGVAIAGTAVGNVFTHPEGPKRREQVEYVKTWIRHASIMGAPHIRIFAGDVQKGSTQEEAEKNFLECYAECLELASQEGVFLGLENHHGIVAEADALLRLIRAADSKWAGVNLDSGNFRTEDPYGDLEKIAPYAVNVQLKMMLQRKGAPQKEDMDIPRLLEILKNANYQGWFTLEYEEEENPHTKVPEILSRLKPMLHS
jgi:sugar phosphate isomerase/epimerase